MKIQKIMAGGLAALAAGATLAFGAFAVTTLQDFASVSGTTLSSPVIVVGDMNAGALSTAAIAQAKAQDTIAAADIAAAVAGYATKTGTCSATGEGLTVSSGVDISTSNTKVYLADGLNTAKTTLTKSDLPTILASDTVTVSGTDYTYDQYITLGAKTVTFGKSSESIDPRLYVDLGTASGTPAYTAMVVFNKPLNISDAANVQGKTLDLFGNSYTIASGSGGTNAGYNPLILFGAGLTKTLDEGVPATVNIDDTDYTVEANYVSSTSALIKVGEETSSALAEGASDVVGGLNLYIKSILYSSKTGSVSKVIVSLGTEKITLGSAAAAKLGQAATSVQNTLVTTTGDANGISKLTVAVAAQKGTEDHVDTGETYADPVFKSFKVGFGGMAPAVDSIARDTIDISPSGSLSAQLTMTDYRGHEGTIVFAYDNDSVTTAAAPQLADTNGYEYHVRENESVQLNEYVILAQGDFSHLFQLTEINDITESTANIKLTDKFSDDVITINMEAPGYDNATFYVDGQTYYVINTSSDDDFVFTWGTTSSPINPGNETTVFPFLRGNLGELVAIVGNASTLTFDANTWLDVPGGNGDTGRYPIQAVAAMASGSTLTAGQITYGFDEATNLTLNNISTNTGLISLMDGYPAILLVEEKGKDTASALKRNAIGVKTAASGTSPMKMGISSTVYFTDGNAVEDNTRISNTYIADEIDRFGTYVTTDSYEQGKSTIFYPDTQATVSVAFGVDPSFSTTSAASGMSYEEAVPVTNAVAKFASEIAATPTSDLILIGGPCVNTLVAQLLNMSTASGDCYNDFVAAYPTMGVVKVVENAFVEGKKALIVAGKTAADTRNLADNYVIKGDLDEMA